MTVRTYIKMAAVCVGFTLAMPSSALAAKGVNCEFVRDCTFEFNGARTADKASLQINSERNGIVFQSKKYSVVNSEQSGSGTKVLAETGQQEILLEVVSRRSTLFHFSDKSSNAYSIYNGRCRGRY